MDLAGHDRFMREPMARSADIRVGEALLSAGWAALASARAETIDVHLRAGGNIPGIIALRIDGAMVEASTQRGQWTHFFAVSDVAMVEVVLRGGKRGR